MRTFRILKRLYIKVSIYLSDEYSQANVYRKYFGVKIGKNVRMIGKHISFGHESYLVEIGDDVTITSGVKFQPHDGAVGIFRREYPGINIFERIKVGNNVFIGEDSMIMYGITIGDNVVIGARSVVTKDIPSNSVAVGVPARVIKTIDEYKEEALKKAIFVTEIDFKKRKNKILMALSKK